MPRIHRTITVLFLCLFLLWIARPSAALTFQFTEGANLTALRTSNPSMYADLWTGFNIGANDWAARLTTPTTIRIAVEVGTINFPILAYCAPTERLVPYSDIAAALGLPAAPPPIHTGVPNVTVDASMVWTTTANLRAIGHPSGFIGTAGVDAQIFVNLLYAYDIDRTDGIRTGTNDLAGAFAHEIGHLGFLSITDGVASAAATVRAGESVTLHPYVMDLFRFSSESVRDVSPTTTDKYLSLDNGVSDADGGELSLFFSNGSMVDGTQGHHWRGSDSIGVMRPIIPRGTVVEVTDADVWGMRAIGWQAAGSNPAPAAGEPGSVLMLGWVLVLCLVTRKGKRNGVI